MNRLAAIILSLLLISIAVYGQDLPAPFADVSSDFGPRNCSGHSWFHDGIDYTQGEGAAINAVEWGFIRFIGDEGDGYGKKVELIGLNGDWLYGHMFSNSYDSIGHWKERSAVLVNPNNTTERVTTTVLIQWSDIVGRAQNVYAPYPYNWLVLNTDGQYILREDGQNILTTNEVNQSEAIGPMGNSGNSDGVHLHLRLRWQGDKDNPLLFVARPIESGYSEPDYQVQILSPNDAEDGKADGRIVVSNRNGRVVKIRAKILSSNGLDLDKVEFYLDSTNQASRIASFCYGGRRGEDKGSNVVPTNGTSASGVMPIGNVRGNDDFYQIPWNINGVKAGAHCLYCLAYSVRDPNTPIRSESIPIEIDNTLIPCAIQPAPGATNVPVFREGQKSPSGAEIKISFNAPVDTATFGPQTVSFSPGLAGSFTTAWNSDFTEAIMALTDWEQDLRYSGIGYY